MVRSEAIDPPPSPRHILPPKPRPDLYVYPALNRFGLAHELMAWARAVVWGHDHGARPIAPIWLRVRLGPYLRHERDKRAYFLVFTPGGAIAGLRRLALLASARRIEAARGWPDSPATHGRPTVVVFRTRVEGDDTLLPQIHGREAMLRDVLLRITKPRYHPPRAPPDSVAIHVRLGDFRTVAPDSVDVSSRNFRLPLDWYVNRLAALRAALGRDVRAILYSDGDDGDLGPLLACRGVVRAPRRAAITDLLAIGQSAVVISSGSAFSLLGAFLGGACRLCHPDRMMAPAYGDQREIESAYDAPLSVDFVAAVVARLAGQPVPARPRLDRDGTADGFGRCRNEYAIKPRA